MDIGSIGSPVASAPALPAARDYTTTVSAPSGVAAVAAVKPANAAGSLSEITDAVAKLNQAAQNLGSGIEFSVDSDTKQVVVKVVDQATQELIRQMPTKEALEIAKSLEHSPRQGILIRQQG